MLVSDLATFGLDLATFGSNSLKYARIFLSSAQIQRRSNAHHHSFIGFDQIDRLSTKAQSNSTRGGCRLTSGLHFFHLSGSSGELISNSIRLTSGQPYPYYRPSQIMGQTRNWSIAYQSPLLNINFNTY